jgi:hypothetical protein
MFMRHNESGRQKVAEDGHPPQQSPTAHSPLSSPKDLQGAESGSQQSNSRSLGERINTTQGIVTIVATLVTLIFGGGSAVAIVRHFSSHENSLRHISTPVGSVPPAYDPTPANSPLGLTVGQARAGLLTSSDLAVIEGGLAASDIELPPNTYPVCASLSKSLPSALTVTRVFQDSNGPFWAEEMEVFNSPDNANIALGRESENPACVTSYSPPYSHVSTISGQIAGLCDEDEAWSAVITSTDDTSIIYFGTVRCGQVLVSFYAEPGQGLPGDSEENFVIGMRLAVRKFQEMPECETVAPSSECLS